MKCIFCKHGTTSRGLATVTLSRSSTTVVFKDVPADLCDNCGEDYVSDATSARLLELAETAVSNGVETEVRRFAA